MSRFHALFCFFGISSVALGEQCAAPETSSTLLQTSHTKSGAAAETCKDYTAQYDEVDHQALNAGAPFGASDEDGDRCIFYADNKNQCGKHDDEDFLALEMCCNCGGGSTYMQERSLAVNNASVFLSEESECPANFSAITTFTACRAALDLVSITAGHDYNGAGSEADWPKGCYYCKNTAGCSNGVWFNSHASGNNVAGTRRFCQKNYNPTNVEILFVGDSDIDYWDSAVGFPGSFNVGVGGYTTQDVIKEVDGWVADLDPKWVVIVVGENDIGPRRAPTTKALERFKEIVGKFIGDGARVIYLGTKPEPGSKNLYTEYQYYDAELRKFAIEQAKGKDLPPFQMIDVFKSFTSQTELYNSDKLHMSRLGYKFWNGWVKLAMASTTPCIRWMDGVCMESTIIANR